MRHLGNLYDDVRIDIEEAHRNFVKPNEPVFQKRSLYLTGLLIRLGLWKRLVESGSIRDWFDEFHYYWVNNLGCRPLKLHDFFWLYSHYRAKFQTIGVTEHTDAQHFIETWQLHDIIYSIFHSAYKYALHPLSFFPYRKYIRHAKYVLEYGCGVAPITYSALKYGNLKKCMFTVADLRQFTFHYAKYRLSNCKNVSFIDIQPDVLPKFSTRFDLVFAMAVLEHLLNPLQVVQHIHRNMSNRAYLIFDYIKSEGGGLDTTESIKERARVLEFIEDNFKLITGKIDKHDSMGTTIVMKK